MTHALLITSHIVPHNGLFRLLSLQHGRLSVLADQADLFALFNSLDGLFTRDDHGRWQVGERGQEGSSCRSSVLLEDRAGGETTGRRGLAWGWFRERTRASHSLHDDDSGHGLDDRHSPGQDTRIVSTLGGEDTGRSVVLDGRLFLSDRGGGLETDPIGSAVPTSSAPVVARESKSHLQNPPPPNSPKVNVLAVGNSTLNTTAPVGRGTQRPILSLDKHIVMLAPVNLGPSEPRPNLESLGRGDRQHGMSQDRLELVETRFTESVGYSSDDTGDGPSEGIIVRLGLSNECLHLFARRLVGTSGEFLIDLSSGDRLDQIDVFFTQHLVLVIFKTGDPDLAGTSDKRDNLDPISLGQVLFSDRSRGNPSNRLPRRRPSTSRTRLDAVLGQVGVIGVRRSRVEIGLGVIVRTLILVHHSQTDGRSEGDTVFSTGLDLDRVVFVSLWREGMSIEREKSRW